MGHTHSKPGEKPAVRSDRDIDIDSEPDLLPELDDISEDDNCSEPDTALAEGAKDHSAPNNTSGLDLIGLPDLQQPRHRVTQNKTRQHQAAIALATCHELYPDAYPGMLAILNRWQASRVGPFLGPGNILPDRPGHEDEHDFEVIDVVDPKEDFEPKPHSEEKPKRSPDPMTTPPSPNPRSGRRTSIGIRCSAQDKPSTETKAFRS